MAWGLAIAGIVGAAADLYSTSQSGKAAKSAGAANRQQAREDRNVVLASTEPDRALAYGATSDLGTLYGYNVGPYTSPSDLVSGNIPGTSAASTGLYNVYGGGKSAGGSGGG